MQHNADCVVIIDEAYVDFGAQSAVPLIEKYENLLVVQTMSKSRSLAGLRIGYALGSETLIATLEAVKNSYNSYTMDALALAAGEAAVKDEAYFQDTCRKVMGTRERTADALRQLGFTVQPSLTNFLFVTHPTKKCRRFLNICGRKTSSSDILSCRALTTICASPSAPTNRWTVYWKRSGLSYKLYSIKKERKKPSALLLCLDDDSQPFCKHSRLLHRHERATQFGICVRYRDAVQHTVGQVQPRQ